MRGKKMKNMNEQNKSKDRCKEKLDEEAQAYI